MTFAIVPRNFDPQIRVRVPEPAGLAYEVCRILDAQVLFGDRYQEALGLAWGTESHGKIDSRSGESGSVNDLAKSIAEWIAPETPKYINWLQGVCPTEWKNVDLYRLLGLHKLRFEASEEHIRLAYRHKVLLHHPDKRKAKGKPVLEDDYFGAITKAYEVLCHPLKRRAFDSVDPVFDNSVPSSSAANCGDASNFFKTFAPVFERNARWSKEHPVPLLGNEDTPFEAVDRFYAFWFDFDSWREFSFLDEEDKEKGECREERRWIEKQNKSVREKRRKDELKRIRKLVETAYAQDPRVAQYKEEEKRKKEEQKQAKREEQRRKEEQAEEERKAVEEMARLELEAKEKALKEKAAQDKKERDFRKKARQRERKSIEELAKSQNYFVQSKEGTDSETERLQNVANLDKLCKFLSFEKLGLLREALSSPNGKSANEVFETYVSELEDTMNEEQKRLAGLQKGDEGVSKKAEESAGVWTEDESQTLVKAMTLFPVGTKSRWEVIAEFINDRCGCEKRKTGKNVIAQVKNLQKIESNTQVPKQNPGTLVQSKKLASGAASQVESAPTQRIEEDAWSVDEQKLLEQALKTFPANMGSERWEKIADCIPGKTKKECIKRYKELAELVKAKKAAQQKVNIS